MNIRRPLMMAALASTVLAGCETVEDMVQDERFRNFACLGAGVGVALLSGDDADEAILQGLATGLVCSFLTNYWAERLDQRDQELLMEATQRSMESGQTETFSNPETGVTAEVRVRNTVPSGQVVNREIPVLLDRVEETPPLEVSDGAYEVVTNANVRGGPGTNYRVVGSVSGGDVVQSFGKVRDAEWYLIAEGGAGSGYVHQDLLRSTTMAVTPRSAPGATRTASVSTELPCRTMEQEVTMPDGEPVTQTFRACEQADGEWDIERV